MHKMKKNDWGYSFSNWVAMGKMIIPFENLDGVYKPPSQLVPLKMGFQGGLYMPKYGSWKPISRLWDLQKELEVKF